MTKVRLRAWHSAIIEDSDGRMVATAADVHTARALVRSINAGVNLLAAAKEMMRQDAVQSATYNSNPFMATAADHLGEAIIQAESVAPVSAEGR